MKTFVLLFLFLVICNTTVAIASSQFALEATIEYVFSETGNATVKKTIQLTNLTTNVYPSVYFHDLPEDASNVIAVNDTGKLNAGVTFENGVKQVKLPIKQESIGFNKSIKFIITYETRSLAQKEGEYWNIQIPAFNSNEEISGYNVTIALPDNWGTPTRITPSSSPPLRWTHEELGAQPITISYGPLPTDEPEVSNTSALPLPLMAGVLGGGVFVALLYTIGKKLLV